MLLEACGLPSILNVGFYFEELKTVASKCNVLANAKVDLVKYATTYRRLLPWVGVPEAVGQQS